MRSLILLALTASGPFAADPVPNPVAVPGIVELSKVRADPPRATDTDLIDIGKTRFYKIANYEGPVTYEVTGDALLFKEVEKAITLGIVVQGESEPSYPDVPAGSVILWGKKPGTVDLAAWGVVAGKPKKLLTKSFRVGDGPIPPPTPPPNPAPIPADGLHVLIVYETEDILPATQQSIVFGKTIRDYLNAKCPAGADGKTKQWRIYDKDVDTGGESKLWQDAMKRPRTSTPWVIVSNGKSGYEGPLPADTVKMIELLKKFGE